MENCRSARVQVRRASQGAASSQLDRHFSKEEEEEEEEEGAALLHLRFLASLLVPLPHHLGLVETLLSILVAQALLQGGYFGRIGDPHHIRRSTQAPQICALFG